MRSAGIVHVAASMSTSSQVASRTSPERAAPAASGLASLVFAASGARAGEGHRAGHPLQHAVAQLHLVQQRRGAAAEQAAVQRAHGEAVGGEGAGRLGACRPCKRRLSTAMAKRSAATCLPRCGCLSTRTSRCRILPGEHANRGQVVQHPVSPRVPLGIPSTRTQDSRLKGLAGVR